MSNFGPTPPNNDPYQPPQPPQAPNNGQQWPQQGGYSNSPYQNSPYQDQNPEPKNNNAKIGIIAAAVAIVVALIIAAIFAIPALGKKDNNVVPDPAPTTSSEASESAEPTEEPSEEPSEDPFADVKKTDDYYLPTSLGSYPYEDYVSLKATDAEYVAKITETVKTPAMTDDEIVYTSKNICYSLDNGVSVDKTIKHFVTLARETGIPDYEMGVVFGGSVSVYCDSHLAEVKQYIETMRPPAATS